MGIQKQRGFTIIELSLFFAVSGLLLVTLLAGISISIQNQRFTDSVNGTQSFLQQQYGDTQITINERSNNLCDSSTSGRGTSDCFIVGKLIDLGKFDAVADETKMSSYDVIVDQKAVDAALDSQDPPTEIDFFNNNTSDVDKANTRAIKNSVSDQTYIIPWGAKFNSVESSSGEDSPGSGIAGDTRYILVVRSPLTGVISTFMLDIPPAEELFDTDDPYSIAGHVKNIDEAGDKSIKGCVVSADFSGTKAMIKMTPGSTQDAVTTQFDTTEKFLWCG